MKIFTNLRRFLRCCFKLQPKIRRFHELQHQNIFVFFPIELIGNRNFFKKYKGTPRAWRFLKVLGWKNEQEIERGREYVWWLRKCEGKGKKVNGKKGEGDWVCRLCGEAKIGLGFFFNVLKILNDYHLVSSEFTYQNSFRVSLAQFFETRLFEK